ncbi:hypothetical protein ACWC09_10875 [Streptomyces sp. NPDC001617]
MEYDYFDAAHYRGSGEVASIAGAVVGVVGMVEVAGQPGFGRVWSLAIA